MAGLAYKTFDLVGEALDAPSASIAGASFFDRLRPLGVLASYIRAYGPAAQEEVVYSRISPPGWESFYADRQFQKVNYLAREVKRRENAFRWSDIQLTSKPERNLARALVDNGFPDGLAIPCHGALGYTAVVSLAVERLDQLSPDETSAIRMASLILHSRMRMLCERTTPQPPRLTQRERDCLAFVSEGRTDSQIADIMGISLSTTITHLKNARAKLQVRSRAEAVAKALLWGVI